MNQIVPNNNNYILLDVLLCSIAEYFYELCRTLTSPVGVQKLYLYSFWALFVLYEVQLDNNPKKKTGQSINNGCETQWY